MGGSNFCALCGSALNGQEVCPACGTPVALFGPPAEQVTSAATGNFEPPVPGGALYEGSFPPARRPLPRGPVVLFVGNIMLLLVALSAVVGGAGALLPAPGRPTPLSGIPTGTATEVAADSPIYTVSVPTPRATKTPTKTGGGLPPPAPTATPRPKPTATPAPTATPQPTPTATGTPGAGG